MLMSLLACETLCYGLSTRNLKKIKVQSFSIKVEYIFSIDLPCACVFVGRCYKFVYNAYTCEVRSAAQ